MSTEQIYAPVELDSYDNVSLLPVNEALAYCSERSNDHTEWLFITAERTLYVNVSLLPVNEALAHCSE